MDLRIRNSGIRNSGFRIRNSEIRFEFEFWIRIFFKKKNLICPFFFFIAGVSGRVVQNDFLYGLRLSNVEGRGACPLRATSGAPTFGVTNTS